MKKVLPILPIPLALIGIVWISVFKSTNEIIAYIGGAVFTFAAILILGINSYRNRLNDMKAEREIFKRLTNAEPFSAILTCTNIKKIGKCNSDKKIFSLELYPANTDITLLKKISAQKATKQEFTKASRLSNGIVYLTEREVQRLKRLNVVMFYPEYKLLTKFNAYKPFLKNNAIVFDSNDWEQIP